MRFDRYTSSINRSDRINKNAMIRVDLSRRTGRPCISTALELLLNRQSAYQVLHLIGSGDARIKPYFNRPRVEQLFKKIIRTYGQGRYLPDGPTDERGWGDLLGNVAGSLILRRQMIVNKLNKMSPGMLNHWVKCLKGSILELKVLEDWIFFHREQVFRQVSA